MKKIIKIFGVILLVFVVILVFVIVKDVIDSNKTNTPPITNNGGNSGNNNNGNNTGDDPNKKPEEPEKEVYTTYEPADELVRKFNIITLNSFCEEGCDITLTYLRVCIYWFGGGPAVKEAMVESLNMIVNHPDFDELNRNKKIEIYIDTEYVKSLHANITYSFSFFVAGESSKAKEEVNFTGRVATKDQVSIKQEGVNEVFAYYKTNYE